MVPHSDYYCIDDEESLEFPVFVDWQRWIFTTSGHEYRLEILSVVLVRACVKYAQLNWDK